CEQHVLLQTVILDLPLERGPQLSFTRDHEPRVRHMRQNKARGLDEVPLPFVGYERGDVADDWRVVREPEILMKRRRRRGVASAARWRSSPSECATSIVRCPSARSPMIVVRTWFCPPRHVRAVSMWSENISAACGAAAPTAWRASGTHNRSSASTPPGRSLHP